MKNTDKIILIGFFSAFIVLVGLFLFSHFQQNLTPSFGITHAQDLHTDLVNGKSSQTWIFTVWKVALALANVIVIVMLLFVAVVNIVHLQYDTYAIKKSLPLLIIGIIMANFSLLICRMIVDAAQVLTNTFAGNPAGLAHDLLCGMGFLTSQAGTNLTVTATIVSLLTGGVGGVGALIAGGLIIVVIILLVVLIAVLILSFLLWIRKFVIFLLVAVAPVAFILYAFPPTQGLFKQWWSWFLKWTFMGPIVMLLVWVASQIGSGNCTVTTNGTNNFNISALFAECGVLYLAAIVPFKLGGPIMSAWGNLGKKASMLGQGGALRKPIDAGIQKQKDLVKGTASNYFYNKTGLGRQMGARAAHIDELLKTQKEEAEGIKADARQRVPKNKMNKLEFRQNEARTAVGTNEASIQENINKMDKGDLLEGLSEKDVRKLTGDLTAMEAANRNVDVKSRINIAKKSVAKRIGLDIFYKSQSNLDDNNNVQTAQRDVLKKSIDDGTFREGVDGVTTTVHDSEGNERGTKRVTYADLINDSADFSAKGKSTHGELQKKFFEIAKGKQQQATAFRERNAGAYDYDAILDRNISGRQHAEMAPFLKDEANTDFLNTTGFNNLEDTRAESGQIKVFGTAEIRGTNEDMDRAARGEWSQNERLANDACIIKRDSNLQHVLTGVRNGDRAGVFAIDDWVNRIQEARESWRGQVDAQGNPIQTDHNGNNAGMFKSNTYKESLARIPMPAQRGRIEEEIARQYNESNGTSLSYQDLAQDQDLLDDALNHFSVKDFTPAGRDAISMAHRQFLTNAVGEVVHDKFLRYGSTPGAVTTSVSPEGDPHPVTNPRRRNSGSSNGTGAPTPTPTPTPGGISGGSGGSTGGAPTTPTPTTPSTPSSGSGGGSGSSSGSSSSGGGGTTNGSEGENTSGSTTNSGSAEQIKELGQLQGQVTVNGELFTGTLQFRDSSTNKNFDVAVSGGNYTTDFAEGEHSMMVGPKNQGISDIYVNFIIVANGTRTLNLSFGPGSTNVNTGF